MPPVGKALEAAHPDRREEIVTASAQIDVQAVRCYAWFDLLQEAGGRNDSGVTIQLLTDGKPSSTLEMTIKPSVKQSGGLGDL